MSSLFPPRWFVWFILTLVLVVRVRAALDFDDRRVRDPDSYALLARRLALEHTFGLEREPQTGQLFPTAFRPPLYPILLAVVFPEDRGQYQPCIATLHVILGLATMWLVWRWAAENSLTRIQSLIAVLLVGIDPVLLRQSSEIMTETLATFLAELTLLLLTRCGNERRSPGWSLLAGASLGLCVLCRPTFLVWAVLIGIAAASRVRHQRGALRRWMALCLMAAAVVSPWIVRNLLQFGRPIATTTHGGYTLLRSNNPRYYEHLLAKPWGTVWDTAEFDADFQQSFQDSLLRPLSTDPRIWEPAIDQFAYQQAWQAIRENPQMFIYATAVRLARLFGIVPWRISDSESAKARWLRYAVGAFYAVEFALALLGAWTLGRKLLQSSWLWGTLLMLSFTLVHALYWTDMRMRAPLVPVIALAAAVGAGRLWRLIAKPQTVSAAALASIA